MAARRELLLLMAVLPGCATSGSSDAEHLDVETYTRVVVLPVATSVSGDCRGQSEYFASQLRTALLREIERGDTVEGAMYVGADSTATALLEIDVQALDRDGDRVYWKVSCNVVDARSGAIIRPWAAQEGISGINGARRRFAGDRSLTSIAEFQARSTCQALGIGAGQQAD